MLTLSSSWHLRRRRRRARAVPAPRSHRRGDRRRRPDGRHRRHRLRCRPSAPSTTARIVLLFGMMVLVAHLRLARRPGGARRDRRSARVARPAALLVRSSSSSRRALGAVRQRHDLPGLHAARARHRRRRAAGGRCRSCSRSPPPRTSAVLATITGNPQNMLIGTASGISFRAFSARARADRRRRARDRRRAPVPDLPARSAAGRRCAAGAAGAAGRSIARC